jgi:hypothetical protein
MNISEIYVNIASKRVVIIAFVIFFVLQLFANKTAWAEELDITDEPPVESVLGVYAGISIIPYTWWQFFSIMSSDLKYNMGASQATTYEANVRFYFFSAGTSVGTDDNVIGKINHIAGYLGIKQISMRYVNNSFDGTAHWSGGLAPGMSPRFEYKGNIQSVDLLYNFDKPSLIKDLGSAYLGLCWTTFNLPVELNASIYDNTGKESVSFYDDRYKGEMYGLVVGFDLLKNKIQRSGFGIFGSGTDRFCLGNSSLSNEAIAWGNALNPGRTVIDKKPFTFYVENETIIGLQWTTYFKEGRITLALGYDFMLAALMISGPSEGVSKDKVGWDFVQMHIRHGIILRAICIL